MTLQDIVNMTFHLKVHPSVDRILMFNKDHELFGEMQYVTTLEDDIEDDGEIKKQVMKIFNSDITEETTVALILDAFGSTTMPCPQVFSKTLKLKPDDSKDEYASNTVVLNWSKPTLKDGVEFDNTKLPEPRMCILDFPESVARPLGLPPVVIMQRFEVPEEAKKEDSARRGFDPSAGGHFIKQIYHHWPKNEETVAVLEMEKIKITLYEHMVLKQIAPISKE